MKAAIAAGSLALLCSCGALAQGAAPVPEKPRPEEKILDFSYTYPAEAEAIPALKKWLEADRTRTKAEARRYALEGRATARQEKRPFNEHYLHKEWVLLGQTGRLMSFVATAESFTGGAHGNSSFASLLWDRGAGRLIGPADLFGSGQILADVLRDRFCKALDRERQDRRGDEPLDGHFAECPPLSEVRIAPVDVDRDGRFERVRFFAAPYVAGPYAEGAYEVDVAIPRELIETHLKPEYRASFEADPDSAQPQ